MAKTSSLTKKLALTISSIVLCVVLIGVVVYAALSQNVNLTNTITVSTGGQAKSIVTVYEKSIAGTGAVATLPTEPTWGDAILTKGENEDSAEKELTPIVFSYAEGKNVYAYKITVQNTSVASGTETGEVKVTISSSLEANTEIDVWCGEDYASLAKLDNNTGVSFTENSLATGNTVTYYVVVCTNTALESMTAADAKDFDITVNVMAI